MATLQDFKTLQASLSSSEQAKIAELYLTDRDSAVSKMITIAADKGVTLTSEEVQSFISQLDEDDEFDDIELNKRLLRLLGHRGPSCRGHQGSS